MITNSFIIKCESNRVVPWRTADPLCPRLKLQGCKPQIGEVESELVSSSRSRAVFFSHTLTL